MTRNQKTLALAILVIVASIGFIVLARLDKQNHQDDSAARSQANTRVGSPAPNILGEDIDGKEFKLSDYRGKVVMLDFWGFW